MSKSRPLYPAEFTRQIVELDVSHGEFHGQSPQLARACAIVIALGPGKADVDNSSMGEVLSGA